MHILRMIIVGLFVGVLARFFYPGAVHLGWILTIALGIAGSFVGGLIGSAIKRPADGDYIHPAGLIMSVIGGMVLIFLARLLGLGA